MKKKTTKFDDVIKIVDDLKNKRNKIQLQLARLSIPHDVNGEDFIQIRTSRALKHCEQRGTTFHNSLLKHYAENGYLSINQLLCIFR